MRDVEHELWEREVCWGCMLQWRTVKDCGRHGRYLVRICQSSQRRKVEEGSKLEEVGTCTWLTIIRPGGSGCRQRKRHSFLNHKVRYNKSKKYQIQRVNEHGSVVYADPTNPQRSLLVSNGLSRVPVHAPLTSTVICLQRRW